MGIIRQRRNIQDKTKGFRLIGRRQVLQREKQTKGDDPVELDEKNNHRGDGALRVVLGVGWLHWHQEFT
jgi:hypothetical protein